MPFKNKIRKINNILNITQRLRDGASLELSNDQINKLKDIYSEGNKRISKNYNIDLGSLGYPI